MHSSSSSSSIGDALAVAEADVTSSVPLSCSAPRGPATARLSDRRSFVRSVGRYHDVRLTTAAIASGLPPPTSIVAQFHVIAVVTIDEFVYNVGSHGQRQALMLATALARRDFV